MRRLAEKLYQKSEIKDAYSLAAAIVDIVRVTGISNFYADTPMGACPLCGNQDTQTPCSLCQDDKRDQSTLCIIETVGDLWALERTGSYKGLYHVLGGVLSPLDGIRPENLRLNILEQRLQQSNGQIQEVIIALSATMNGQTTSHYIAHLLESYQLKVTKLSHGVPVGGELDYLDDGTLSLALQSRRMMG